MIDRPFFSVLVTAYNREGEIERCMRSCQQQSFEDFEIVVVDDASTDRTAAVLAALDEPRLRLVRHQRNRGISPARATAVDHAQGEWFVMLDSDWALLPHSLARLRELIETLPVGVRIIRSRLESDDGRVDPELMPAEEITDYDARVRWLEALAVHGAGSDAGHCMNRSVFDATNYFEDRRGAMETLWELSLARRESSMWVSEILGRQYVDAANSHSREVRTTMLIPRLLEDAPDALWMAQTMLAEHGDELACHAPHYRRWLLESAALQAFLAGRRRAGTYYSWAAIRAGSVGAKVWATVPLGILGPRPLAYAKLAGRRSRAARPTQRRSGVRSVDADHR